MEHKTTAEVAKRLGVDHNTLSVYVARHPELKPDLRVGTAFLWDDSDIERLAQHRMRPISRGPRRRNK